VNEAWRIMLPGWRDLIDIAIVGVLFYQVWRLMRGTRAVPMFLGLLLILFTYVIVQLMELDLISLIFREFATVWAIAFVILFQPELRRFLIHFGNSPLLSRLFPLRSTGLVEEVSKAAADLSRRQYGGLFVITRDVGLRGVQETGVRLQAEVSKELLVSIFFPRTPLHDGAAIITGSLVQAAKCILPLSTSLALDGMGTRHRAAVGISEESDAVVVVVSEETGQIRLAMGGRLTLIRDEAHLTETLRRVVNKGAKKTRTLDESAEAPQDADAPPA
jgi:diadenylate cyclase